MPITSIIRDTPNNVSLVRVISTDTLAVVGSPNYIRDQMVNIRSLNSGFWQWFKTDMLIVSASDENAIYQFTDSTFSSLQIYGQPVSGTVSPGLANEIAYYATNGSTIDGLPTVPSSLLASNSLGGIVWIPAPSFVSTTSVLYTAPDGSDVTGNGSILDPYRTITHALAVTTTANASNPITISAQTGVYSETALALKPWIFIQGNNSILNLTGAITLDSSFSSGGTIIVENFFNANITGGMTLNFTVAGVNQNYVQIKDIEITAITAINITGFQGNTIAVLENTFSTGTPFNITMQDVYGAVEGCDSTNITFLATDTTNYSCQMIDNLVFNNLTFTSTSTGGVNSFIKGCILLNQLNATGTNITLEIDVDSISSTSVPTLSGGAVANYFNVADALTTNYTPVNFTAVNTSVKGAIEGIDNALGFIMGTIPNVVYVSIRGNDTTGTGSILFPYQTVANAMSFITSATASNPYTLFLLDGPYNETSQILLKPWVNISSYTSNTLINNSADIILDASWAGTTQALMAIENVIVQNNLVLDFNTVPTASGPDITINNMSVYGTLTLQGNTDNPTIFFLTNNFLENAIFNNATIVSEGNYYFGGLTSGTTAFIADTNFSSTGDFYNDDVSLTGATAGPTQQNFYLRSGVLRDNLAVSGAVATLSIDATTYVTPTVSGGAVVQLPSISNGLTTNYTPVNFTAVNPSVEGAIAGIDNQFGVYGTYVSNSATGISLSDATPANVVSISLPAGKWEVSGVIGFFPAGTTTYTQIASGISSISATLPSFPIENNFQLLSAAFQTGVESILSCGPARITLAVTTTIYLVARSTFAVSTMTADGFIGANKVG